MIGITGAESDVTCRHISSHVGTYQHMSACPHVLTHVSVQIRSALLVSEVPRVMVHVGTCRHTSAHVGMSACADTCQLGGKVQMFGIRGAESDPICQHMSAHISTCRHVHMC